jgi:hypothetical protein
MAESVAEVLGQIVGTLLFPFLVMLVIGGVYYLIRRPTASPEKGEPLGWKPAGARSGEPRHES